MNTAEMAAISGGLVGKGALRIAGQASDHRPGQGLGRMNSLITAAIEQRRLLKLAYSTGNRIVEPHV